MSGKPGLALAAEAASEAPAHTFNGVAGLPACA